MLIKLTQLLLTCILLTNHAFAVDIKRMGTVEQTLHLTRANTQSTLTLPEYELSPKAQHNINQKIKHALSTSYATTTPKHLQLGMNRVPLYVSQGIC